MIFEEEARAKLKEGIDILADLVCVGLGPKKRNESIIKQIQSTDPYQNMGISMGKEIAAKMKETCSDGTTTSILLFRSLVANGIKQIASGANPIQIKTGMEKALAAVIKELEKTTIPVEIDNISILSVSEILVDAIKKVGKSGVILIEEGNGAETTLEVFEGMQLSQGYASAYFVTNTKTLTVEMSHPYIFLTDKKIASIQELLPVLQSATSSGRELLIIAQEIDPESLSSLAINKLRGTLKVCAVTGTTLNANPEFLESVEKVLITKEKTILLSSKQGNGVAVIKTGVTQKKQMFEDSLNRTKAALEEGLVTGGGVALLLASKAISSLKLSRDEAVGAQLLAKACEAPMQQIIANAGHESSLILEKIKPGFGFNAITEKVEDLFAAGIVDPAKVIKQALTLAASAAGVVFLSELLIAIEEK